MRRRVVILGVAAGVVLLTAPAALAKGNGTALISGPGSGQGASVNITIRGGPSDGSSEPAFWGFVGDVGLFERRSVARPKVALGPRFDVMLFVGPEPGTSGTPQLIRLDLYPYAADGPWSYAPPGQRGRFVGEIPTGWYPAPGSFLDRLVSLGLPAHAPGAALRAVSGGAASHAASRSARWPGVAAAAALAAMVAAGAVLGRARARTVRAA